MRHTVIAFLILFLNVQLVSATDEPVKHLDVPDIVSFEEAKRVFVETTLQLREKTKLDAAELHEIHMITYSLEKAVAYFSENMKDEQQEVAKKMAAIIERVHIGSENNRAADTETNL